MPEYLYSCGEHTQSVFHLMKEEPEILCNVCKKRMHRRPMAFSVNWGGLPPHLEHTRAPVIKNMLDNAPKRREEYQKIKESRKD